MRRTARGAGRSIRTRLLVALTLVTLLTLALSTLLSAVLDIKLFRDHMVRDLEVLASVVGENCVSALVFDDPETAERHLATLEREYQIRSALLLDAGGRDFARWLREPADETEPTLPSIIKGLSPPLEISYAIAFDGRPLGRLVIDAELVELARQFRIYMPLAGLVGLLTLGAALLAALRLRQRIAEPILQLAERSRAISAERNFSHRLPNPDAGREIGTLVDGFNAVLQGLEERESELSRQSRTLDRANDKLRDLAMDLAMQEETEKARLAAELHDGPLQKLALAQIQLEAGSREQDEESPERLAAGLELLSEATMELRSLQFDLSPPVLECGGVSAALAWLAESTQSRWGLTMTYRLEGSAPNLDRAHKLILFQCARELVMNMVKHARANRGDIRLTRLDRCVELWVEDDGIGFAASHAARGGHSGLDSGQGYGLQGVCERLALVDGGLAMEELRPGARARLWIPIEPESG
jgi:signal transduction histidine kinase